MKTQRLGEMLISRNVLNPDQLRIALDEQKRSREKLGRCLVRLGLISEPELVRCLAAFMKCSGVEGARLQPTSEALSQLPAAVARRYRVLPVRYDSAGKRLTLATSEPDNLVALNEIAAQLDDGTRIEAVLTGDDMLTRALDVHYNHGETLTAHVHHLDNPDAVEADEGRSAIVCLVDELLVNAARRNASDIHLEPEPGFVRVRYRVDGVLHPVISMHKRHWSSLVVRIKVLAGLDIAEQRLPQDGRISLNLSGRPMDVRVSLLPTVHGENIVLRLLDRWRHVVTFEQMGLDQQAMDGISRLLRYPDGVIFVTGPTGSGKTTTLYTMLNQLNTGEVNIMTLEDPVECQLPVVRQCSVSDLNQMTFADGVRAILRQDPDIILIGEVRDEQTASMAMRAATSGHLVFATLHCASAVAALPRLFDMGVSPSLLAGCLKGIIAQRLVRRLCFHCRSAFTPEAAEAQCLAGVVPPSVLYRAVGCDACGGTGYSGRVTLAEIWQPHARLGDELGTGTISLSGLRALHALEDFRTLARCGMQAVARGLTTWDELCRVVPMDD